MTTLTTLTGWKRQMVYGFARYTHESGRALIWQMVYGFARYTHESGRALICTDTTVVRRNAGWGHRRGHKTIKVWRATVDGKAHNPNQGFYTFLTNAVIDCEKTLG